MMPDTRCHLLELPAEIRNRIFDLMVEDLMGEAEPGVHRDSDYDNHYEDPQGPPYQWAPRARPSCAAETADFWYIRPWQFYGLTQACKQLRSEYRPLWMRALSVRLTTYTLPLFVATFLPEGPLSSYAPEVIQVSWHRDEHKDSSVRDTLAPLFLLKAQYPAVRFEFVPLSIADYKTMPGEELCDFCEDLKDMLPGGWGQYRYKDLDCECEDDHTTWDDWVEMEEDRIRYTHAFYGLLANVNPLWVKHILARNITIHHSIAKDDRYVTFRIICKEPFCHGVSDSQSAWDLLKRWGIFKLSHSAEVDIVLVYNEMEETEIDGHQVVNSLLREFKVEGIP